MRYLRFRSWLDDLDQTAGQLTEIYVEEVRRHLSTDSAHAYGDFLATLSAWAEQRGIAYQGVPVGTIKRHATGKGNAGKAEVIAAVRAKGFKPADDNEADALALLLWAIETRGARRQVHGAIQALGGHDGPLGSVAWHMLGRGCSVREWARRQGRGGRQVRCEQTEGMLIAALDLLASHYGKKARVAA